MSDLSQYLKQLTEDWQKKINELDREEKRALRRKDAAQKTVSYLKVKISSIKEIKQEFETQLHAATSKLEEIKTKK